MAGVSATRRVSSGATTVRPVKGYGASSEAGGFVEAIDASNRVAVQARLDDERRKKNDSSEEFLDEKEIATDLAYVKSAIEALSASGVYDETEGEYMQKTTMHVNVYGTNQTIINRDEEKDSSKKEVFIEVVDEVDELV